MMSIACTLTPDSMSSADFPALTFPLQRASNVFLKPPKEFVSTAGKVNN